MTAIERRAELSAFLRSRRARLRPEDMDLPAGGRRRTPGLRREEVAQLARVGVTWYTWLEQGRPIHPSAAVLDAIARALRLDPSEHAHLRRLTGAQEIGEPPPDEWCGTTAVARVVDALDPWPVTVLNDRYDSLGHNRAYARLFGVAGLTRERRNVLRQMFIEPRLRSLLKDWEGEAGHLVAVFRAAMAGHAGDPGWTSLVDELTAVSPEFRRMWARHDVAAPGSKVKDFIHPLVGPLRLDTTSMWLADRPGVRMLTYAPADDATAEGLLALREVEPAG